MRHWKAAELLLSETKALSKAAGAERGYAALVLFLLLHQTLDTIVSRVTFTIERADRDAAMFRNDDNTERSPTIAEEPFSKEPGNF